MRVFALALLIASPAFAEDCARFAEPLAYNACLARQGPTARAAHVGAMPARGPMRRIRAPTYHGRREMVFSVGN
jgi:hypothetical protein